MSNLERNQNLIPIVTKVSYRYAKSITGYLVGKIKYHRIVEFADDYWLNIYFTPGTANFEEPAIKTPAGTLYDQRLTISAPGQVINHFQSLEALEEIPVIIKITYCNGTEKLMGSPDNPVIFNSNYREDAKLAADQYQFRCQAQERAFIYDNFFYQGILTIGNLDENFGYWKVGYTEYPLGNLLPQFADIERLTWKDDDKEIIIIFLSDIFSSYQQQNPCLQLVINDTTYTLIKLDNKYAKLDFPTNPFPAVGETCSIKLLLL